MSSPGDVRVFVVEDEQLVVMMIESMLEELGCTMSGTAHSVPEALAALETIAFDVALLDLNLSGTKVFPVADALTAKGMPFIISSGYDSSAIPENFRHVPTVPKPFRIEELDAAIRKAVAKA